MEEPRRSPNLNRKVFLGLATLFAVLLLLWLGAPGRPAAAAIEVSFTPSQSGHLGSFYSKHFFVATVTNYPRWPIILATPSVQWDENGVAVSATYPWGGTNAFHSLNSGEAIPVLLEIPTNSTKFRIWFHYTCYAGPLQKMLSPLVRMCWAQGILFPKRQWLLNERGWWDGRLQLMYGGDWQTNRW